MSADIPTWTDDDGLFALARAELFTSVVGDAMDRLGLMRQYLPPSIRPLQDDMMVIGRAMPVLEADVVSDAADASRNPVVARPFGLMLEALDDLKRHEVYICTGASPTYALWGELMTLRATTLGAAGAVLDGYARDVKGVKRQKFPCFCAGSYGQDQAPRGKVIDFRSTIELGGVRVAPGDVVFGDIDGVCVVPAAAERDVFSAALAKVRTEKAVWNAIEGGMGAREAFERFGAL